jgi:hypothetical protein
MENLEKSQKNSACDTAEIRSGPLLNMKQPCRYWSRIAQPCYPRRADCVVLMWFGVTFCSGCELPILTSGRTQGGSTTCSTMGLGRQTLSAFPRFREAQVQIRKMPVTWSIIRLQAAWNKCDSVLAINVLKIYTVTLLHVEKFCARFVFCVKAISFIGFNTRWSIYRNIF